METVKNEPVVVRGRKKKSNSPPPPSIDRRYHWSDLIPTLRGIDERREAIKREKRWPDKPPMPPRFYGLT